MKYRYACMLCVGWLAVATSVPADIIWSGEQNLSGYAQNIDLNSDSQTDVILSYYIVANFGDYLGFLWAYIDELHIDRSNRILVDASNSLDAALPFGTLVSGSPDSSLEWISGQYAAGRVSYWSTEPPEPDTEWRGLLGETGDVYLGIDFEVEGSTHYGWINVTLGEKNPDLGFETPITASWAYETTPDTPIIAGVIPEPSTGVLTMVGSLSLLLLARSRRRGNLRRISRIPNASPPPEEW